MCYIVPKVTVKTSKCIQHHNPYGTQKEIKEDIGQAFTKVSVCTHMHESMHGQVGDISFIYCCTSTACGEHNV